MSNQHDGQLPSIKYFGTTWYDRGWTYRRRRFWLGGQLRVGGAAGVSTGVFASGGSGLAGGLLAVGTLGKYGLER